MNYFIKELKVPGGKIRDLHKHSNAEDAILKDYGPEALAFISEYSNLADDHTCVISTNNLFSLSSLSENYYKSIINFCRINEILRISRFFEEANAKLPDQGIFIGCLETKYQRKERILKKYPKGLAHIYYFFDFILKRIFPKLPVTRKIYFKITAGRNRALSKTEIMGRLYSCGFAIEDERFIGNLMFFVAKKIKQPSYDPEPSHGPIYKMKRIGKHGKTITVYKLRTMHAYAEFLQPYVYEKNSLREGGKFRNDFRVSTIGKFCRRYWIDEIPMIYNLLRGDLKIVGVRPLSKHYLGLYAEDLKARRLNYTPGLIPPFYADLPKTLDEIMESERRYLDNCDKAPFRTDVKYFFKAVFNILFRKARSN